MLWRVIAGSGPRLGEALALKWSDVDLDTGRTRIEWAIRPIAPKFRAAGEPRLRRVWLKTKQSRRTITIERSALAALRAWKTRQAEEGSQGTQGLIFTSLVGTPRDPDNARKSLKKAYRAIGLDPLPDVHDLRHTYAKILLSRGASLHDVSRILGHSSIKVTSDLYGRWVIGRGDELAEMLSKALDEVGVEVAS